MNQGLPKEWKFVQDHSQDQIFGDPSKGVRIRASIRNLCAYSTFLSQVEPKSFQEAEQVAN